MVAIKEATRRHISKERNLNAIKLLRNFKNASRKLNTLFKNLANQPNYTELISS
jgi:predicted outer membrane protein